MNATHDIAPGLEGIVAFATEIAEPDRDGGVLRYRGVDVEELVGRLPFEQVWGLLVDGAPLPGLQDVAHTPSPQAGVQAAIAGLAPTSRPLIDLDPREARADLARVSAATLALVAQIARGDARPPVPQARVDAEESLAARFLARWRGEADPAHAKAIDAYWITAAEHGMNASTFTARVVASTGADVAAAFSAA